MSNRKMKSLTKMKSSILYAMITIVIIFVRLLRPFILIRFGRITSYIFGHFVFDTEYYLSEKKLEDQKTLDFFYYDYKYDSHKQPTNEQWYQMVRRHLRIHPFVAHFYRVNKIIPGGQAHLVKMNVETFLSRDLNGVLRSCETQIQFTDEENEQGRLFLKGIGIRPGEKFICLNVRDSAYKEKFQKWKNDWSYHNHRDSEIDTYEEASLALAEKGYWIFRMGKTVHKPLRLKHPFIHDYAMMPYRNDFLDIWLMANCFFCISTQSGLDMVSSVFRKPIVFVNHIGPFQQIHSWTNSLSIPKKLIWSNTSNYLSLSELIQHGYSKFLDFERNGISIVDCSQNEITEAVLEMESRLNGTWIDTEQDEKLQKIFWQKFKAEKDFCKFHGIIHPEARIGSDFLRKNHNWLFIN